MKTRLEYKNLLMLFIMIAFFLDTTLIHAENGNNTPPGSVIITSPIAGIDGATLNDMIRADYKSLYDLGWDPEEGIIGTMGGSDTSQIIVKVYDYNPEASNKRGIVIYSIYINQSASLYTERHHNVPIKIYNSSSGNYEDLFQTTDSNNIKQLAQGARVYANGVNTHKTWVDLFAMTPSSSLPEFQQIIIEITIVGNANLIKAKIPSIGIVTIEEGVVVRAGEGELVKFCEDNPSNSLCNLYSTIRNPTIGQEDFVIAAHRGWWGYATGANVPVENSIDAINKADEMEFKIVEMDVTTTSDKTLLFMHDYVLKRLTDYTGDKYSFDLPWSTISQYNARQRDGTVVNNKPLSLYLDALPVLKEKDMIMMVDIKELQSNGAGANCLANCDYQDKEKQKQSWASITKQVIEEAENNDATKNLVIKTYYTPSDILGLIGDDLMDEVLWVPIIVPNNFKDDVGNPNISLMIDFVDEWNQNHSKGLVACYETNFFAPDDVMLQAFSHGGIRYENLLHYIYATTNRRSGVFSEEPVGPKGNVNRWGRWKVKNPSNDIRGDFFQLKNISYGKYMLITTDRLDVWKKIKSKY